jgi:hypothetical protein
MEIQVGRSDFGKSSRENSMTHVLGQPMVEKTHWDKQVAENLVEALARGTGP